MTPQGTPRLLSATSSLGGREAVRRARAHLPGPATCSKGQSAQTARPGFGSHQGLLGGLAVRGCCKPCQISPRCGAKSGGQGDAVEPVDLGHLRRGLVRCHQAPHGRAAVTPFSRGCQLGTYGRASCASRKHWRTVQGKGSGVAGVCCCRPSGAEKPGSAGVPHCASGSATPAILHLLCRDRPSAPGRTSHPITRVWGWGGRFHALLLITPPCSESLQVSACFLLNVPPSLSYSADAFSPPRPAGQTRMARGGPSIHAQSPTLRTPLEGELQSHFSLFSISRMARTGSLTQHGPWGAGPAAVHPPQVGRANPILPGGRRIGRGLSFRRSHTSASSETGQTFLSAAETDAGRQLGAVAREAVHSSGRKEVGGHRHCPLRGRQR